MTIHCSCGHQVDDMDQTEALSLGDWDDWGERAVMYVNYCLECAHEAHQQGRVLYDEGEENKWMGGS